jgi:hypothetical protein
MMTRTDIVVRLGAVGLLSLSARAQWAVSYVEDPSRVDPAAATDQAEKDYAWGDLDRDGDIDLVVVRKQPWTTTGRRANMLLMNEDGVLTDRTAEYASASDVAGDQGFLTPTNDRDVVIADVDGDEWLDIITAVTLTDNDAKHLSHPRVYMNLGEIDGAWQGFRYEDARIPQMHDTAGPRFCGISAGDLTGDGRPELFFSDYDNGGEQIFDFNDRLLVNDGNGFFTDQTFLRLNSPDMYIANFGISNNIADMNGDGLNDIVRMTSNGPYHIGIAYNNPLDVGFFTQYDEVYTLSAYHSQVGDLDGDGMLDIIAIDDSIDRYLLNQGNDPQGMAAFTTNSFPSQTGILHAGDVVVADLDQDGYNDVIIADVDVDLTGCSDRTFILHNLGPESPVLFQEEADQIIPYDRLAGVHDVAVFDLDGDGVLDIVLGRCVGTDVWLGQPAFAIGFSYPGGVPSFVDAGVATVIKVQLDPVGGTIVPGSPTLYLSSNGGPFATATLTEIGPDLYQALINGGACADRLNFYVTAELSGGLVFADPESAPATTYAAVVTSTATVLMADTFEGDVSGWTIVNDPSLTGGGWETASPNATLYGGGVAAPGADATPAPGTMAFVTANGPPGSAAASFDVDGGPTYLLSPIVDLGGSESVVRYARWAFTADGMPDALTIEVSDDGGDSWVLVESVSDTGGSWETAEFLVGDYVTVSSQLRVRFGVCDCPNDSVTEAGIDDFEVVALCSNAPCPWDLGGDGNVGINDFLALLGAWGPNPGHPADFDGDDVVGILDFLALLGSWGPCP